MLQSKKKVFLFMFHFITFSNTEMSRRNEMDCIRVLCSWCHSSWRLAYRCWILHCPTRTLCM